MIKKIAFLSMIIIFGCKSFAFDIAYSPLENVVKSGEVVFVGFVNSTSVVDRSLGIIKSHTNIIVEKCLVGDSCEKGKIVDINYLSQVSFGTSLPVKFIVGTQVIMILTKQLQESPYEFDSDINGGTDTLLVCDAFPYSVLDEHSVFSCENGVTGREFKPLSIKTIMPPLPTRVP